MVGYHVPEDTSPKIFFEEIVPEQFKSRIAQNPVKGAGDSEFSIQFDIEGSNGGTWSIIMVDGSELVVKNGAYDAAIITLQMSESDWREAVTGKAEFSTGLEIGMTEGHIRDQLAAFKNIKGKLVNEISRDDGSILSVTIIFNKTEIPETIIKMKMSDLKELREGKIDGPNAFMQGKIQIEGDMMFAMKLGQLQF